MKRHFYVYILECSDGSYYVGVTNDIDRRLTEHKNGANSTSFTFTRRPLILRYCQPFDRIREAIAWEKQVKGWSRKKKEALFNRDWNEIIRLANLKGPSTTSTGSV